MPQSVKVPARSNASIRRGMLAVAALAVIAVNLIVLSKSWGAIRKGNPDFAGFYSAGRIVREAQGRNVYNYDVQWAIEQRLFPTADRGAPLVFNHPPSELLLFRPLAQLPYTAAFLVFFAVNLVAIIAAALLLTLDLPRARRYFPWLVIFCGVSPFTLSAVVQGQDSVLLLLFHVLALLLLVRGRELAAGAVLALALFKFQLVLVTVLAFLVVRRWRFIAGFALCSALQLLASIALIGWEGVAHYPALLAQFSRLPLRVAAVDPGYMANIRGFFYTLLRQHATLKAIDLISAVVSLIPLALLIWVWSRGSLAEHAWKLNFALAIGVSCLVSYHMYPHDMAVMLLPGIVAVDYVLRNDVPRGLRTALLGFGALLFFGRYLGVGVMSVVFVGLLGFTVALAVAAVKAANLPATTVSEAANSAD